MNLVRAWGAGVVALLAAMWGLAFIIDPVYGPFRPVELTFAVAGAAAVAVARRFTGSRARR